MLLIKCRRSPGLGTDRRLLLPLANNASHMDAFTQFLRNGAMSRDAEMHFWVYLQWRNFNIGGKKCVISSVLE